MRRGFTLLEVLVATLLTATLLAILWGLFSTYLRLFEVGQAQTDQAQLAQAILRQLSDDLGSAIEDSAEQGAAAAPAAGAGTPAFARRFGLVGTRHALRFDVLQTIPPEQLPPADAELSDASRRTREAPVPRVPELRTILYSFEQRFAPEDRQEKLALDSEEADLAPAQPGLTRRELDFETPLETRGTAGSAGRGPQTTAELPGGLTPQAAQETNADLPATDRPREQPVAWLPEVAGLEFRYFDGSGWSEEWNSLERKSLPVAVEVALQVKRSDVSAVVGPEGRPAAQRSERDEEMLLRDEELQREQEIRDELEEGGSAVRRAAGRAAPPQLAVYRQVIEVPCAKMRPSLKRVLPTSLLQPMELPPPPLPPLSLMDRLPLRKTPLDPRKPDQWMRIETE